MTELPDTTVLPDDTTVLPDATGGRSPAAARPGFAGSAVVCSGLTYRFGSHTAVDHVDLRIERGETFGLLGLNGAGKTTTIRMLPTLLTPMAGAISVFGVDTAARPMLVRRIIGYVPQLLSADATLTGRENVELFARLFDVPRADRRERVEGALAAMGLQRAVPGADHARLAPGDQQMQPAVV